jgi:hypothetical protein
LGACGGYLAPQLRAAQAGEETHKSKQKQDQEHVVAWKERARTFT